jgi:hypothetical protein
MPSNDSLRQDQIMDVYHIWFFYHPYVFLGKWCQLWICLSIHMPMFILCTPIMHGLYINIKTNLCPCPKGLSLQKL